MGSHQEIVDGERGVPCHGVSIKMAVDSQRGVYCHGVTSRDSGCQRGVSCHGVTIKRTMDGDICHCHCHFGW